ncbi:hypothetical protein HPB51_029642 [Rhipicephalus microplus]|uniref:Uncharacterized protein n=1 Tax=Rhipicephalus microplus TaxID=6941 RepID=A0A9J6CTY5_RHIMP|nr:hypothetical protein HPB51_029642 [Rhipicephalus microplus]
MLVHGSSWATMGREHGESTTVAIEATPPPSVAAFENRSAGTAIWPLGDAGHNEGSCAAGNRTRLRPIKETERTWRRQRARRADCACGGRTCVHGAIADFAAPPLTLQMLRNDKWPSASSAPSEVVYVHRLCMRPIAIASRTTVHVLLNQYSHARRKPRKTKQNKNSRPAAKALCLISRPYNGAVDEENGLRPGFVIQNARRRAAAVSVA